TNSRTLLRIVLFSRPSPRLNRSKRVDGKAGTNKQAWRAIVLRQQGAEFLVLEGQTGFELPNIEIPRGSRIALELHHHLKAVLELETFALYPLEPEFQCADSLSPRFFVVESVHDGFDNVKAGRWLSTSFPHNLHFADRADFIAIEQWQKEWVLARSSVSQTTFGTTGSLGRIR